MNWKERITTNPKQCGGRPCIRGMRIRVVDVLDLLAAGLSREQILDELPDLAEEDIEAALRYASRRAAPRAITLVCCRQRLQPNSAMVLLWPFP